MNALCRYVSLLSLLLMGIACVPDASPETITPEPTILICNGWQVRRGDAVYCLVVDEQRAVLQSGTAQITLQQSDRSLVLDGTVVLVQTEQVLRVLVVEGRAILGAAGQSRIIVAGNESAIRSQNGSASIPSRVLALEAHYLQAIAFDQLPRSIAIEQVLINTHDQARDRGDTDVACPEQTGWTGHHVVQRGDILARLAAQYRVSLAEMIAANCLDNSAILQVGQVLRVPVSVTATNAPTLSSADVTIGFRADAYQLQAGDCTHLRWDIFGMGTIYLDETLVSDRQSQEVCPMADREYQLRVVLEDGSELEQRLRISVSE